MPDTPTKLTKEKKEMKTSNLKNNPVSWQPPPAGRSPRPEEESYGSLFGCEDMASHPPSQADHRIGRVAAWGTCTRRWCRR